MTAKEFIESKEWTQTTVHFSINDVVDLMQEFARIKCLEAIEKTKHAAVEVLMKNYLDSSVNYIANQVIQNISNQDVMPEL